ncbi:glycosyltransferase family 4 protein [Lutibacter sp.]|uniref:glycosyltransferase family 4 protein n=1 Tax=Lutibacter sp. TaxID=1925666 RepID=UPI0025C344CC|nr:glycosyltransferase family 4 protein [Lutibacter sp.]MCF6168400.1 glycosyltransferase family 4 protein [Lutibacter sp.]
MDNKVIWVLNQTAGKPSSGWGERHYYFAKYWIKKGYTVKIISGSYNHLFINQPETSDRTFTLEKVEENITFCWVKIPKYDGGSIFKLWSMIVFAFKILFLKAKLLGKPDIIVVSSMPIFQILSGIYLKRKYKSQKLIFEIRDLWPLTPIYLLGYSKYHPVVVVMKWIEKIGYKKSDKIVSLLPNANKYIDKISNTPSKFHWIPNGIDQNLLVTEVLPTNMINKIPKDKFIIGYTGTIGMANTMGYFIEASILLKDNTDIHFLVVGDGYLKEEYVTMTYGNKNITFINKIKKSQVQSILSYIDVCYVGRYNNKLYEYGVSYNKYFDYMLAKKPILESSNCINSPAELSECALIVQPENSSAIIEGIYKLKAIPKQQLSNMGEKGYIYVKKYHNFEYLSHKYLNLF